MKHLLAATAGCVLLGLTPNAYADTPQEIVTEVSDTARQGLADNILSSEELETLLERVDVDGVARFALGKYADDLSDEAFNPYLDAFREYLKIQMQDYLGDFADASVEITASQQRGQQVIVETDVRRADGETVNVNWRLKKAGTDWQIIDVEAMNLWLAIEQRAQFIAELDKNGGDINALTENLKTKS